MLAFRKTLEHSVYFLYFPPCVCPFGNFLFFIFYTGLSLHNSHHEEHLSPTEMVPVNSFCDTSPFTAVEQMWCVLARGMLCSYVSTQQRCMTRPKADLSIAVMSFNKASADGVRHTVCVFVSCFLCACKPVMSAQGEAAENGCFFPTFSCLQGIPALWLLQVKLKTISLSSDKLHL